MASPWHDASIPEEDVIDVVRGMGYQVDAQVGTAGYRIDVAVSQDLVTRHGGLIEFESKPGRTVFMFAFTTTLVGAMKP